MGNIPDYLLDPPEPMECPSCPVCGTEMYDYVYIDIDGEVVGCSECVRSKDPWEYLEMLEDEDNF